MSYLWLYFFFSASSCTLILIHLVHLLCQGIPIESWPWRWDWNCLLVTIVRCHLEINYYSLPSQYILTLGNIFTIFQSKRVQVKESICKDSPDPRRLAQSLCLSLCLEVSPSSGSASPCPGVSKGGRSFQKGARSHRQQGGGVAGSKMQYAPKMKMAPGAQLELTVQRTILYKKM